jgi:hypothetical protein
MRGFAAVLAPEEPRPFRIGLLEGLLDESETPREGLDLVERLLRDRGSTTGLRLQVVDVLGNVLGSWKETEGVVDLLRRVAEEDADVRVREAARRAIEQGG